MISAVSWWLAIEVCGLLALPLAWRLLSRLPGRGYALAKALGLLLATYALWLGASFHLVANDLGGACLGLLVLAGLSTWLGWPGLRREPGVGGEGTGPRPLLAWLRAHLRLVLASEAVFLVVYAAWVYFRAHSGEIAGTEKPMEFAFLNGVLNSRSFPPQDPWLSGYGISYYYFGYVMVAFLVRITGAAPAVAFNLAVAAWYALALSAAFAVVYELVALAERSRRRADGSATRDEADGGEGAEEQRSDRPEPATSGRGLRWGLLGALFLGVIGNLEGVFEVGYHTGSMPASWLKWIDIKGMMENPPTGTVQGGWMWWWHASRVIHDKDLLGASVEVIDEFPFFSFLLGDLHPHVLALPFVLLAVALALNLLLAAQAWAGEAGRTELAGAEARAGAALAGAGTLGVAASIEATALRWQRGAGAFWRTLGGALGLGTPGILLYGVALGALAFLNTWDFPIYLALAALAFGAGLALKHGLGWWASGQALAAGFVLGIIGYLAYLPFYLGFQSQAGGILPNLLFPSRFSQFFIMFGLFLAIAVFFMALLTSGWRRLPGAGDGRGRTLGRRFLAILPWPILGPALLIGALLLLAVILPSGRAMIGDLLNNPAVKERLPAGGLGQLLALVAQARLGSPWTYIILAVLLTWVLALLWQVLSSAGNGRATQHHAGWDGGTRTEGLMALDVFALLLLALAMLLTFSVEFVYLRDLFGSRMNTVFKFYYQAWVLLALVSAYGLSRLAERTTPVRLAAPALLLAILLGAAGMVYPLLATPNKANDFAGPATLDGLAYLRQGNPGDAAAIDWLRANAAPSAVVLEAPGGSYSPEGAERVSMSTGNPTLLGWDFHERQWRGKAFEQVTAGRNDAVDRIYRSGRPEDLRAALEQWGIDFVYVGDLERRKYGITDAALVRFDRAGLTLAYDAQGVRIYAR